MAALNGGHPTVCTQTLLNHYEHGDITSTQLKQAIVEKIYAKE